MVRNKLLLARNAESLTNPLVAKKICQSYAFSQQRWY